MLLRICLFLSSVITVATINAAETRIAVSDLMAGYISETIQALAESESINVSVINSGSLPAIDALRAEEISLAIVATPELDNGLLDDTFKTISFAYSTAMIVVSDTNPVNEISFYDLQTIFSSGSSSTVGGSSKTESKLTGKQRFKPLVIKDDAGISVELFRHQVLKGEAFNLTVNAVVGSEIERMLAKNTSTIAVLPYLPDNKAIKALMVSIDSEVPAFGPTNNNVYYGDYPIRLPFQIAYKKDREAALSKIIRILLSDEVTEALRKNHLFVPPDSIRMGFVDSLGFYIQ